MKPDLLIDSATLQRHLADPSWRIVDVRHDLMDTAAGPRAYAAGHIPGAIFAHIDDDLSGPKTGKNGRHPLPDRAALIEKFRRWGISRNTRIVAYDAQGGQFAGRLWWLARWLGHPAVVVLDGGWPAWLRSGGPSSTETPQYSRGDFEAHEALVRVVDATDVAAAIEHRDRTLVDARLAERYRGEVEPIDPVAGHIPGAINRPWPSNLNADQTFKPPEQLRKEFDALLGARDAADVLHQCGSGVTSAHNVLAMELAGLPGSALYAGSWSEWIADPDRPIARGSEP